MARIFLLGATGFIGGTVLTTLTSKYLEHTYILLARDGYRASAIKAIYEKKFPGVKIETVEGSLNDVDKLEKVAEGADIVINTANNDHKASAEALVRGLTKRASTSQPAYLIHTSGTAILTDDKDYGFGTTVSPQIYDDFDNVTKVTRDLPDDAWHREVDQVIVAAGDEGKIKSCIVSPPTVYGIGTGIWGKKTSIQIPFLLSSIRKNGKGFTVHKGETIWNNVHIKDLAQLYLILVERALSGDEDKNIWGPDCYFFAESGEHNWGLLIHNLVSLMYEKGLLETLEVEELTPDELRKLTELENAPKLWFANSRCKALRARKLLGWKPKEGDIWGTLREEVGLHARGEK